MTRGGGGALFALAVLLWSSGLAAQVKAWLSLTLQLLVIPALPLGRRPPLAPPPLAAGVTAASRDHVLASAALPTRAQADTGQIGVLRSGSFYESPEAGGGMAVIAPRAAVLAGPPLAPPSLLDSPENCSQLCRETEGCAWFEYCSEEVSRRGCQACWEARMHSRHQRAVANFHRYASESCACLPLHPCTQGGCSDASGQPLEHLACSLLTANCSLPTVARQGARVQVTSGALCMRRETGCGL